MDMERVVFATDIQKKKPKWSTWGALEVAIEYDAQLDSHDGGVVLFRAQDGTIEDLSEEVEIDVLGDWPSRSIRITKPFNANAKGAHQVGFGINITQLPIWDEDAKDAEKAGFDDGTLTFMDGNQVRNVAWRGFYVAMNDSPLETVKAGSEPLPSWIENFLTITPDIGGSDTVNKWTNGLFEEISLNALPNKAKSLFYDNSIPELGSKFHTDYYGQSAFPDVIEEERIRWLKLQNILDDNERLFELASMHFLCRDLSRAKWLDNEYRSQLPDKVDQFFKFVGAPPNTSSADIQGYINAYGRDLTAAQSCDRLRREYMDAIKRCYYFAYICFDDHWNNIIENATAEAFEELETVLLSDNYKEHWLPTLIGIPDEKGSLPFKEQMALLTEKLALYKYHLDETQQVPELQENIDNIIKMLTEAAQRTGLLRTNLIDFKPMDIKLDPQAIFNEQTQREVDRFKAMERAAAASRDVIFIDVDIQSNVAHAFLRDEAKPLGLYTWESALKFW